MVEKLYVPHVDYALPDVGQIPNNRTIFNLTLRVGRGEFPKYFLILLLVLSCLVCKFCRLAVCIVVVIICVFVVLCVHCFFFYFICRTSG